MIHRQISEINWEFVLAGVLTENIPYNSISKNEKGVLTSINQQNSGYSIAEPMDGVLDLVAIAENAGE